MNKLTRIRFLSLILLAEAALFVSLQSAHFLIPNYPVPPAPERPIDSSSVLAKFSFENPAALKSWEEKVFKGQTQYQVLRHENEGFLNTTSQNSSSGLYVKVETQVSQKLILAWKWRAKLFPQKKEPQRLANRAEDDFAARVYAIFPGSNFFKTDVIEYIWDEKLPIGTIASSPFSQRVKLFVIQNGPPSAENGGWRKVERSVYDDYRSLFGKETSRSLGAIALMSDSDNTGTRSEADFGDILLKTKQSTYSKRKNES